MIKHVFLIVMLFAVSCTVMGAYAQVPDDQGKNGTSNMNGTHPGSPKTGSSQNDNTEHKLPNGVRYFDNGTIIENMHGRDAKFHLERNIKFNPGGTPPNPHSPDPVIGCAPAGNHTYSLERISCGLVESDPLNNSTQTQQQLQANQQFWVYGGDAVAMGVPYSFFKDAAGLHIGVQAPSKGQYAGFYAVTPDTNSTLFHAILSAPARSLPVPANDSASSFQNGLYVQTSQPFINYVTCVSVTNSVGTVWLLVNTFGDANQALTFNVLWADSAPDQALTRDCTLVTNGSNYLRAYLDGTLVYSNSTLNLNMPPPFNSFLEPQSSYAGGVLYGIYGNFYETAGDTIGVINAPSGASTASLVDTTGSVLASAPVSSGTGTINIGKYHEPVDANMVLYDKSGAKIISTPSDYNVYGGDMYSIINSTVAPAAPNSVSARASSFSSVMVSWVAPADNGGPAVTGYKVQRSSGGTWVTIANVSGTSYLDTGLAPATAYQYRIISQSSAGSSAPSGTVSVTTPQRVALSVVSLDQSGAQLQGMWVVLGMPDGTSVGAFTPVTFNASAGMGYSITATSFGNDTFAHWDGGSTNPTRNVVPVSNVTLDAFYNTPSKYTISRTGSGLVLSDPLNATRTQQQIVSQGYWTLGGTAANGTYQVSEGSQGLDIAVQSSSPGAYSGYYVSGQSSGASLFHAVVSVPQRQIGTTGQDFQGGLYIENTAAVNYVTCVAITNQDGTYWSIVSATGDANHATSFNTLWSDQSQNQPLTRDCTIITNGSSFLRVYLDGIEVYTSSSLNLQLKASSGAMVPILDTESSYGSMLGALYGDYYSASSQLVKIGNLPANSTMVQLVGPAGNVLASAPVTSGNATIDMGMLHMPVVGTIRAVGAQNQTVSSSSETGIWGGDTYMSAPAG